MSRPRAVLSAWDKTGIVELGRGLAERGWEVLSTGGTAAALREAAVEVVDVSLVTDHPEMMEGRVKTLHPAIHAGILARRDVEEDMRALARSGYRPIDLVAVDLYPFRRTARTPGATLDRVLEHIDVGGPTLVRAAAKNHRHVWVVVDPDDYALALDAVDGREAADRLRRRFAAKAFRKISSYDSDVATYLDEEKSLLPDHLNLRMKRWGAPLRYGENPGQAGALYVVEGDREGLGALRQLRGKRLSYNNLLDLDGALVGLAPFARSPDPAVCVVKHSTPCGLAERERLVDAFERARATDPVSAFGSVIALSRSVDVATARALAKVFVECVVAPGFDAEALAVLEAKPGLRLLAFPSERGDAAARFLARAAGGEGARSLRSVHGGLLAQSLPEPPSASDDSGWTVASERAPSPEEARDLAFAWAAVASVKSNAVLLARDRATVGIGSGQASRVDSAKLAVRKARDAGLASELDGCVLASDAFFPFRDGVDEAARAGVRAIVQPGGSKRDREVVAAADEHGVAMAFTGRRLFRH